MVSEAKKVSETKPVEISIDEERCRFSMYDPLGCKKCLQVCPEAVFASVPVEEKRDFSLPKEQLFDPVLWMLVIGWPDYCTACRACIESCPYQAISIKINGVPI